MNKISRRIFLRLSGTAVAGTLLSTTGCTAKTLLAPEATAAPTASSAAAATVSPTATLPPAATAAPEATFTPVATATLLPQKTYRRPEIIKFFPDMKSQVVRGRDAAVWNGDVLDPEKVRQLVDRSITRLTGINDVKKSWLALFNPDEKIAIKVNTFRNSTIWTHPELVKAVVDSLQEAGIPGEQITIFDYYTSELEEASFTINKDGPGVRCYGTDESYSTSWEIQGSSFRLSDILVNCDALINIPVLKSHMIAGFTFALKNHYGSVSYPDGLHIIEKYLPGLNALAPIKESTRLVIGDILSANTKWTNSWPYWDADVKGDSILMSFDPLAHDTVGLEILTKMAEEKGNPTGSIMGMASPWMKTAVEAGLGTSDMNQIEIAEI